MPTDGNLDGLLTNVSRHRGRPLIVLHHDLGQVGPSGLWVEGVHADYMFLDTEGSTSRTAASICHEVAHMLLGHKGRPINEDIALTPHIRPTLAARFLARDGYSDPEEHDAEDLATQLVAEHARRDRTAQLNQNTVSARLR